LPAVDVVAVADCDADRLGRVADRYRIPRRYRDYRALLDLAGMEAVAICVPPQFHAEIALAALDAGKHLLIEKPLAVSLREADDLVARAAEVGTKATVGFNLRCHRLLRTARNLVQCGDVGTPTLMRTLFTVGDEYRAAPPAWRLDPTLGGGLLFEHAVHHFDLWRFLLRSEVEEVFAQQGVASSAGEHATVTARLANGALATSVFAHGCSENVVEIYGSAGWVRVSCYRFDGLEFHAMSESSSGIRGRLRGAARLLKELPRAARRLHQGGDFVASYAAEWRQFIDAIRDDTAVECTLADGRRALQIALATVHSAASGQPVHVARAPTTLAPLAHHSPRSEVRK